jgi:SAM-dependent methyltransferase
MTKLYSQLAQVYHEMYQSIFDYKKEFNRYHRLLNKHRCHRVLEIGCGSGNLAPYFLDASYDYMGMDVAEGMLKIAKRMAPAAQFVGADMRKFHFNRKFDAVIITGRSFTYMTTNSDVLGALQSVHAALRPHGLLIFDNFDATAIFKDFSKRLTQKAWSGGKRFVRCSEKSMNLETGWTWNWNARYEVTENKKKQVMFDESILRAFTPDELSLFLRLAGFGILSSKKREDCEIVTVARRM